MRYLVLGLLAAAAASAYLTRYCLAVANTTIEAELGFTPEQMGWIFSAFSLGYFINQVPGGWLGNRFGTRGALAGISIVWSLCTVWTSLVSTFRPMLQSRIAFGLAQAGLVPITALAIRDWFPDRRRGLASAVIGASMSIGGAVTMALTAELLGVLDWRVVFRIYSLVGIVWSIAFLLFFRTRPQDHRAVNRAELAVIRGSLGRSEPPEPPAESPPEPTENVSNTAVDDSNPYASTLYSAAAIPSEPASTIQVVSRLAVSLSMWGICLQSFFRAAGYMVFVTWFPAILEKGYGVGTKSAGWLTAGPLIAVVAGSLAGGLLIDLLLARTGSKRISRTGVGVATLAVCALATLASAWTGSAYPFVAAMTVGAFFSGLGNPVAWAATMDIAGRYTSIVMAIMNMAGTLGGAALPVVLGYMIGDIERTGGDWNPVIYLFAGIYVCAAVSWLLVNPSHAATERG